MMAIRALYIDLITNEYDLVGIAITTTGARRQDCRGSLKGDLPDHGELEYRNTDAPDRRKD
jgi:hypothetical protein